MHQLDLSRRQFLAASGSAAPKPNIVVILGRRPAPHQPAGHP